MNGQNSYSKSYRESGVDITAGYRAVELMKRHIARTAVPSVVDGIGGFGGIFDPGADKYRHPLLVGGTDGVGTKLKIAFMMERHDTVGIDCVAMCVNDIICCGAKPLFFLDYIALGKNIPEKVAEIVSGVAEGCVQAGCALIGGETAEMPGFYPENEYDLAGFSVGIVEKDLMLDQNSVEAEDILIALPSSGVHSNGFSLVRSIFRLDEDQSALDKRPEPLDETLGEALLRPTSIYVKPMLALFETVTVKSVAHITGGGFYENIPRCLPDGMCAVIEKSSLRIPPIFDVIRSNGRIDEHDMFNTFNMGVGMCVVISPDDEAKALDRLAADGVPAYRIGTIASGQEPVVLR